MKILITSGGTKIPIDKVRDITNMSKGTFGSKIATELLELGHEVMFLKAKYSRSPFEFNYNFFGKYGLAEERFNKTLKFVRDHYNRYNELEYSTFDEYRGCLERWIKIERPDIVMLAAAVSDYGVENTYDGKIRSNDMLTIKLVQLPKIIHLIKTWHPTCKLVGFKLLVGSKETELIAAAERSIAENGCDMIVANDLDDIKEGNHKVHLVYPTNKFKEGSVMHCTYFTDPNDSTFLARKVAEHTLTL